MSIDDSSENRDFQKADSKVYEAFQASSPNISSILHRFILAAAAHNSDPACKIVDNLFLGSARTASDKEALKHLGIRVVVNATIECQPFHTNEFTVHVVPVRDFADVKISEHFDQTIDLIDESVSQGKPVLVHCMAGVSRSASIILAYLVKKHKMSLFDAYVHTKRAREVISPNPGFMQQLLDFERSVHGQTSFPMSWWWHKRYTWPLASTDLPSAAPSPGRVSSPFLMGPQPNLDNQSESATTNTESPVTIALLTPPVDANPSQ